MMKLGINIQFKPNKEIDKLFEDYKILVNDCLQEVKRRYESFNKIKEPQEKKCPNCDEEKKLMWSKEEKICNFCFLRTWSEYTIWKEYHKKLEEKYPVFEGNKGYYNGAIPNAVQIFKSYLEKKKKRDYEIKKKEDDLIKLGGEITKLEFELNALKKRVKTSKSLGIIDDINKIEKELDNKKFSHKRLSKRKLSLISFPLFRGSSIYMGNQNMFKFIPNIDETYKVLEADLIKGDFINLRKEISKQTSEGYAHNKWEISLTNPYEKKGKWVFDLLLGKKNYYQKKFILDCIEKEQWKLIRAKINKRDGRYFLVFPARVIEKACIDLEKEIKKNKAKDVTFCCLSFGLNRPISMIAIKGKKAIDFKTFGNGYPLWKAERETLLKAKISKNIHLHHSVMKHFFNVSDKQIEKNGICFGVEFEQLNECKLCKVRQSCRKEFNQLMNEIYPLKDKIRNKKIRAKIKRERRFESRHSNKKKRNAMIKIFQKKIGNRLSRFKNTYDHQISFEVINYCKKFKKVIFILRDTKGLKSISYQGYYRRIMKDWSINQLKLFIRYKGLLNGMGNILIPYKELTDMVCPKCKEKIGKITTLKLKKIKLLECSKCGFKDNFYFQDCFFIFKKVREMLKM